MFMYDVPNSIKYFWLTTQIMQNENIAMRFISVRGFVFPEF